jgi:hypothetical protein
MPSSVGGGLRFEGGFISRLNELTLDGRAGAAEVGVAAGTAGALATWAGALAAATVAVPAAGFAPAPPWGPASAGSSRDTPTLASMCVRA